MERAITPEDVASHGLSTEEYERIRAALGREPNLLELGIFSVMWSEHCSYKSSRRHLRGLPTSGPRVLQGPGENAGVVDLGDGLAVAFKIESHNHPSFIAPYHGAATGVGGILRDVFTMGARPVAAMNSMRFGAPENPRTAELLRGAVEGIADYGNEVGVPTVAGEVAFDEIYDNNCLVNAFVAGILPSDRIFRGNASGVGNPVIYAGAPTGRDGIHGATRSSAEFGEEIGGDEPNVATGNPELGRLVMEACLELMQGDVVVGIQDMGAAGLTSSSVEMAGRAGNGLELQLESIPMAEEGMTPYELMLSETQERMLFVTEQGREAEAIAIFEKWGVEAKVIGRVTDTGELRLTWHGEEVAALPVEPLTEGAPVYDRPYQRPEWLQELQDFDPASLPEPTDLGGVLRTLLARPTIGSKARLYEKFQQNEKVKVRPGGDAAVVEVDEKGKGIALSVDCPARMVFLDPYMGAMLAVAEACRNVSVVGGEPIGLSDNLNFGNPERPESMWQLVEAIRGLGDACRALDVPVVSGNVSLYNETEGRAIFPTPTCAVVGLLPDASVAVTTWWKQEGHEIALLGECTGEAGGSEYLKAFHGKTAGLPPRLHLEREKAVQDAVRRMVREGLLASAHDCAEGGLAVALAEGCIMGEETKLGATLRLPAEGRKDFLLFAEDPSRVLISYDPSKRAEIEAIAAEAGAPLAVLGSVGGERLVIEDAIDLPVAELDAAWRGALDALLGA